MSKRTLCLLTSLFVFGASSCGIPDESVGVAAGDSTLSRPMLIQKDGQSPARVGGSMRLVVNPDKRQSRRLRQAVAEFARSSSDKTVTFKAPDGRLIDKVTISGRPPADFRMSAATVENGVAGVLTEVPAFDWSYGCSATSGAMLAGYYDRGSYPDMYTGPTDGGLMPLSNSSWGYGECPLSATHAGIDGRSVRGHVDDFWVEYESSDPDPYITGGWTPHPHADCTADFMGTNQSALDNTDGSTTFYYFANGSPRYDPATYEPGQRDGCHGLRLFFESRGYTVLENFNQYIQGYNGNTLGFTLEQYKAEIDAGRPVLIHLTGHTIIGYGYTADTTTIQIHDTWDHWNHTMTWGGSYADLQHRGVSVIKLAPAACVCSTVDACCDGCSFTSAPCDADSNGCTVDDRCSRGVCVAGMAADCSSADDQCNIGKCVSTGASSFTCQADPTRREGWTCNADNNGCTENDTCVSGICMAGAPYVCEGTPEPCRTISCVSAGSYSRTCNWDWAPFEGLACDADGSGCTVGDTCSLGACVAGPAPDCDAFDDQCNKGFCRSLSSDVYECYKNPFPLDGAACDDDNGCTVNNRCRDGICGTGEQVDCRSSADQCNTGVCVSTGGATFECVKAPVGDGTSCNADGNGCTDGDACDSGRCTPGEPVDCSGADDQCNAGYCNSFSADVFACLKDPDPLEGAACNADENGCTVGDRCSAGRCRPGSIPDCKSMDDICNNGACLSTGAHSFECVKDPTGLDGTACNADDNGCTRYDACVAGSCLPGTAADCSPLNSQCTTGLCVSTSFQTFECIYDWAPHEGAPCNADSDGCTVGDSCVSGSCRTGAMADCYLASDQCNTAYCESTGTDEYECRKDPTPYEGWPCNSDGDGCTVGDKCNAGRCFAGNRADCRAMDDPCNTGRCASIDYSSYRCLKDPVPNEGMPCNADSDGCTVNDSCAAGKCVAGAPAGCQALDDDCNLWSCGSTGIYTFECIRDAETLDGGPCNADDDGCTVNDTCAAGDCLAGTAVDCSALDDACNVGACTSTGPNSSECHTDPAPMEGIPCNADDDGCTVHDTCLSGACAAGLPADCSLLDDQCNVGYCGSIGTDEYICLRDPEPFHGNRCDADGNGCTTGDTCVEGACMPGPVADCSRQDDQCNAGYCDPVNPEEFKCLKDPMPFEGSHCNADDDGCTVDDACGGGRCVSGPPADCSGENDQCNTGFCSSLAADSYECLKDPSPHEGNRCDADGTGCTIDDTCSSGGCLAGAAADCSGLDDQCNTGMCVGTGSETFECLKDPVPKEGTMCDADGDGCTVDDTCFEGGCVAGAIQDCSTADDQCNTGYCGSTGTNSFQCLKNPAPHHGKRCNADGSGCTVNDTCSTGRCIAGGRPDCTGMNDQCNTGYCVSTDVNAYECRKNPAPQEGKACDADGNGCTVDDVCGAGVCLTGRGADCSAMDDTCAVGICDSTGINSHACRADETAMDGLVCDDGVACSVDETCASGVCAGVTKTCDDGLDCTADSCDERTGECRFAGNDAVCDDKNPCTVDTCLPGEGCSHAYRNDWSPCVDGDHACIAGACEPIMSNDTCLRAERLTVGNPRHVGAAGYHMFARIPGTCVADSPAAADAYFTFTAPDDGRYEIDVTPDSGNRVILALWSGCALSGDCLDAVDIAGAGAAVPLIGLGSAGGVVIQLVLPAVEGGTGDEGCTIEIRAIESTGDQAPGTDVMDDSGAPGDTNDEPSADNAVGDESPADIPGDADLARDVADGHDSGGDHGAADDVGADVTGVDARVDAGRDDGGSADTGSGGCSSASGGSGVLSILLLLAVTGFMRFRRKAAICRRPPC